MPEYSTFLSTLLGITVIFSLQREVFGQNCACGYIDSNQNVWREAVVSTFTQDAGALPAVRADWRVATDPGIKVPTGFTMQYVSSNVFQFNDALGIKTSAYTGDGVIRTGEIDTLRDDILYGTFRMRARVPSVPGVVFGFFTYKNGTQEQDIEFLSSDRNFHETVHYTNHPSLINGNVDPDATKTVVVSGADFTNFEDHRLDWLPNQTRHYFNGVQTNTLSKNVPATGSHVILNVWSNGDPLFSKGPPTQDAIATIQNVQLYFNSSKPDSESKFTTACANAGRPAVCRI